MTSYAENRFSIVEEEIHNEPLVSIITPSFNQGKFIEDAILSIKNQPYKNIEHIIIDGGSTDNTLDVIKKHEGTYNMRLISERDEGMYDAINKGFRLAEGEIFAYLNCDDLYLPWSIHTAVKHLQNHYIIFGDSIFTNADMTNGSLHFTPPFIEDYYRSNGVITQPAVFFRRFVFEQVGFFDNHTFKLIADCDYWLRCLSAGFKPRKVYEVLAIQRDHEMTQRSTREKLLRQEFNLLRSKYSQKTMFKAILYRVFMHGYWRVALFAFKSGVFYRWNKTKESGIVNLNRWRFFLEVLPMTVRKRLHLKSYISFNLLSQNNVVDT